MRGLRRVINMKTEKELLSKLAEICDSDITLPFGESDAFERELAKFYMPPLNSSATDEELLVWGAQFKNIINQKLEMFRNGQLG